MISGAQSSPPASKVGSGSVNPLGSNSAIRPGRPGGRSGGPRRTTTVSISETLPAATFSRSISIPGAPFSVKAPR